jgi:hypothetical protein
MSAEHDARARRVPSHLLGRRRIEPHGEPGKPGATEPPPRALPRLPAPIIRILIWRKVRSGRRAAQHHLRLELDPPRIVL